jgi:hypothetical protein
MMPKSALLSQDEDAYSKRALVFPKLTQTALGVFGVSDSFASTVRSLIHTGLQRLCENSASLILPNL